MSINKKLKSLNVKPETMISLTYSDGTDCFMHTEDQVEIAIQNTDVIERFAELVATPGFHAQTRWGNDIIQELRDEGYLDDYERGSYCFGEHIGEKISENYYELELIEHSTEAYDYKRGFCTLTAEVVASAGEIIDSDPELSGWNVSFSVDGTTINFDV